MPRLSKATQKAIEEMDHNVLRCRTVGHAWEEIPVSFIRARRKNIGGIHIVFRCVRCSTIRHETWTHSGQLNIRTYKHGPKWETTRTGRSRAPFRVEYMNRRESAPSAQRRKRAS